MRDCTCGRTLVLTAVVLQARTVDTCLATYGCNKAKLRRMLWIRFSLTRDNWTGHADGSKGEAALHHILRFVSLIPCTSEWIAFRRRQDVWPTCREFLDICTGDHEEHALLLCNYFLYMGIEAYVVLGPSSYSPR